MAQILLYDYWRSSTSYRVRIALHLKQLPFRTRAINLLEREHRKDDYLAVNPQGVLPALEIDGMVLTQSLAIIDYLEHVKPIPRLFPDVADMRARALALSYAIAMEVHPVCNLGVAAHAADLIGGDEEAQKQHKADWFKHFIAKGLANVEQMLQQYYGDSLPSPFACGDAPSIFECCLVPQLYNADRWGVDCSAWRHITAIAKNCEALKAIAAAHPDNDKLEA